MTDWNDMKETPDKELESCTVLGHVNGKCALEPVEDSDTSLQHKSSLRSCVKQPRRIFRLAVLSTQRSVFSLHDTQ